MKIYATFLFLLALDLVLSGHMKTHPWFRLYRAALKPRPRIMPTEYKGIYPTTEEEAQAWEEARRKA